MLEVNQRLRYPLTDFVEFSPFSLCSVLIADLKQQKYIYVFPRLSPQNERDGLSFSLPRAQVDSIRHAPREERAASCGAPSLERARGRARALTTATISSSWLGLVGPRKPARPFKT